MTIDEALEILKSIEILSFRDKKRKYFMADVWKAKKVAIKALEQQPNRCDSCVHSEEQDGSNCYECVKGMTDNFETQPTDADCISRQAVDTLVDELARAISDERCCMSRGRSTATIMQDILDLPSVTPQPTRWIPVSERLPETDGVYLTYIVNPYDSQLSYVMLCDYIGQTWCPVDETASNNVVAWMPLPKSYEPQESEDKE